MTPAGCKSTWWCAGLSGVLVIIGLAITLGGMFFNVQEGRIAAQENRIKAIEEKNDTVIEMKADIRYMRNDIADIKLQLKAK